MSDKRTVTLSVKIILPEEDASPKVEATLRKVFEALRGGSSFSLSGSDGSAICTKDARALTGGHTWKSRSSPGR